MIPELEDLVDTGILGNDAEEIDAMDWMHTHQLSSKNLTTGEKLAMTIELQKEIALENKKKKLSTLKQNASNRSLQLERTENNKIESTNKQRDSWTDSQTAKKAGVGVGTVARYNRVMIAQDKRN